MLSASTRSIGPRPAAVTATRSPADTTAWRGSLRAPVARARTLDSSIVSTVR